MIRVQFSSAAADDIREIEAYTVSQFGSEQALNFLDKLQSSIDTIAAMPQMGSLRPALDPPSHQFRYHAILKSFVVVYDVTDNGIRVARVLHGARNLLNELQQNSGEE